MNGSLNSSMQSFTSMKRALLSRWSELAFGKKANYRRLIHSTCDSDFPTQIWQGATGPSRTGIWHAESNEPFSSIMSEVQIQAGRAILSGTFHLPKSAGALVLFAHGSGSSRHSPRNQFVARTLNDAGLATLLFDLLTQEEEAIDMQTRELRFNIHLLAERLDHATKWAKQQEETGDFRIGYFGSSTGGAAALVAAVDVPQDVGAVVSRGGRPDLAGEALPKVQAPTLLIVGGNDDIVIELNEQARDRMHCEVKLEIIPGATHLFEEPGTLEKVATLASDWFAKHIGSARSH